MKKKLAFIIVMAMLMISCAVPAMATETDKQLISVEDFDLTLHESQEKEIVLENGEIATVGIEYIAPPKTKASYDLVDGAWRIYWNEPAYSMEYMIDISGTKITNAYDLVYSTRLCTCDKATLTYTSKKSTGYFEISVSTPVEGSFNAYLTAEISGTKLITKFKTT